jgi:hypothetical protein
MPESEPVNYQVLAAVEVEGVAVDPGHYSGRRSRIVVMYQGQPVPQEWEYKINVGDFGDLDCTAQVVGGSIQLT